ncbi:putative chromatin remodeling complex subunit Arp5 [Meredithblackwellia eburnea MCA 4105]
MATTGDIRSSAIERIVYPIQELPQVVESAPRSSDYLQHNPQQDSIVIDNGASTIRSGWSSERNPRYSIENITSKYRDRKSNQVVLLAGAECHVDTNSRTNTKSPFEGDVVCNFDQMENTLDYLFYKLGVSSQSIQHPIIMTETLCNPQHSRSLTFELLFECYGAPSVAFGIDSLFSFHHANNSNPVPHGADGLVISSSTANTHVIPVLGGKGILSNAKKFAWGSSQAGEYLLKLMQLKYPTFPGRLLSHQSAAMYRDHSYFSEDYTSSIRTLSDPRKLVDVDRVIQFPFVAPVPDEQNEEHLRLQLEKKKEAGRRLQEQAMRQRLEKLVRQEEEWNVFSELKNAKGQGKKMDYDKRLKAAGFSNFEDLEAYLKKLEKSLQRARNKELGIDDNEGKEPPTFPLINVPDHTLNEEDLKEKRRQRLMKAGYDARVRAKAERDAEKLRVAEEKRKDEEMRRDDFNGWLGGVRKTHEDVMLRIKERKKMKEQLSDRKSLAAQNRMKSIANLASEASGGAKKRKRAEKDDEFGKNDSDWAVYREIGNGDDSDDEEEELQLLKDTEQRLLEFDKTFTINDTSERVAMRKHQLLNAFVRGVSPDDPSDTYDPESVEQNSQLHMNIERIRVPEVIFQPHMGGLDQAGLGEIIGHVLKQFTREEQRRLTSNVFVTGGNTLIPFFDNRLRSTMRPILPVDAPLNIVRAASDLNDAWRGMALWSRSDECRRSLVTQAEYWEYGGDYIKAHGLGNVPTPF